jgi:hypothetical protein
MKRIVQSPWGLRRQYCHCDIRPPKKGEMTGWTMAENMRNDDNCEFTSGSADELCDVCGMYPWTFKRLKDEQKWKKKAGYIPIKERGKA